MSRRFMLTVLAYLVPTFALGFVWHLVLFAEAYGRLGIYRPDVIVPFGFLSMLLQGLILAAVYPRVTRDPGSFGSAGRFAALAALLSWTFTTLAVAAKHPMTSVPTFIAIETAFTIAQFVLVAPLVAAASRVSGASVRNAVA